MKTTSQNKILMAFAVVAGLAFAATPAGAQITLVNNAKGFLGSVKTNVCTAHNGTTLVNYDATGVNKLVVAVGTESGFNNQSATITGVRFNGVALTQAVQENSRNNTSYDGGTAAIFYLDDPPQSTGTFAVTATFSGGSANGGLVSIIGLAGTAAGVGTTNKAWFTQAAAGNVSASITTSADGSLVIAAVENSGTQNAAGTPTAVAPLTLIHNGFWGSQYGSVASGYQSVPTSGTTITPTFNTAAGGNIHVVAAEFKYGGPDTNAPTISALSPANNATGVAPGTNLVATFNETIVLGTGNITLKNLTDSTQLAIALPDAQVSAAGAVLTINPTSDLAYSKSYAIQIDATAITDAATNFFAGIADDTTWAFATADEPGISAPATLPGSLSATYGTASAAQSVPVSGSNLTANLTATAQAGFEVSSDGATFGATATFTQSAGSASGTLHVRLAATAPASGSYDTVTAAILTSGGATPVNVGTTGSGNAVAKVTPTVTVTVGTYYHNGSPQGPTSYTTSPTGDTGAATWSYAGTGSTTYGPSSTLPTDVGTYDATVSLAADGNFEAASSAATAFTIDPAPIITVPATLPGSLSTTYGTASAAQSVPVSGTSLVANITATAQAGFEVSSDGSTFGATATFIQSGGNAGGTLDVRLAATAPVAGSYDAATAAILTSTGATNADVATTGSGNAVAKVTPVVTVTVGTYRYTGSPQGPNTYTTSPTGDTGAATWSYEGTGPTIYGPSPTRPTAVGTYNATVSLAADSNFEAASSGPTAFTIDPPLEGDGSWIKDGNDIWSLPGNWTNNQIANGVGKTALFTNNLGGNRTFTIDNTSRTLGSLIWGQGRSVHIAGSGGAVLIFDNGGIPAQLTMRTGSGNSLYFDLPIQLNGSLNISNLMSTDSGKHIDLAALAGSYITNIAPSSVTISNLGGGQVNILGPIVDGPSGSVSVVQDNSGTAPTYALTLAGINTYSGPTTIKSGYLSLQNARAIQNSTLIMSGGRLLLNSGGGTAFTVGGLSAASSGVGYDIALTNSAGAAVALSVGANGSNTTYAGVLSGGGSLIKDGAGTLALAAANTYTGATTVSNGTLLVDGSLSSTAVTINAGGTLGGTGTVAGEVTCDGTVAPGASPGILTLTGNYTLGALGTNRMEVRGPGAGTGYDRLAVQGSAILLGTLEIDAGDYVASTGTAHTIVTAASLSGEFFNAPTSGAEIVAGSNTFVVTYSPTDVVLRAKSGTGPVDDDGDGLTSDIDPDDHNPNTDGGAMGDYDEWLAFGNATSQYEALRIENAARAPNGMVVVWPAIANRHYRLFRTADPALGYVAWTNLVADIPPTSDGMYTNPPAAVKEFYRIDVRLNP